MCRVAGKRVGYTKFYRLNLTLPTDNGVQGARHWVRHVDVLKLVRGAEKMATWLRFQRFKLIRTNG